MSKTMLSCAVWCEVHGPSIICCTQQMHEIDNPSSPTCSTHSSSHIIPSSSQKASSQAHTSTSKIDRIKSPKSGSPKLGSSCSSCSLSLPSHLGDGPLRTIDGVYACFTTRHPSDGARYKALRSATIRALSCESVPSRSGPVFFGDPSIGYSIAYVFRLSDGGVLDGSRRQFALLCTTTEEMELLNAWTFITERFKVLVDKIVGASKDQLTNTATQDRSFLRVKGRQSEKGLAELIGMEDVFVQLHASFSWMLRVWRLHYGDPH